jgi:hypothetical protein
MGRKTVKLTIGPPGFEPGTARYRPPGGFVVAVPRVAVYSRALSTAELRAVQVWRETEI